MQSRCGVAGANNIIFWGATSYLAPVPCNRFFSFDWFILFFQGFVWLLLALFVLTRTVHKFRTGLTAFLAISSVLLMLQTNTWVRTITYEDSGLDNSFKRRAYVAFSGALVSAIANLLMLLLMGWHDEKAVAESGREKTGGYVTESYQTTAPATTPATTTAVHPGRIGETAV
jgi:hypothetical protein